MKNIYTPFKSRMRKFGFLLACCAAGLPNSAFSQITYSFTSAGATGSVGPTAAQISTAYATTNLNNLVTVNNGIQSFAIPSTGIYRIIAIGAQGGYSGGAGAYVSADYTLTAGTAFNILVGQQGDSLDNVLGQQAGTMGNEAGGGGGGSFVADPGNVPYVVAGGGGGNGDGYNTLYHAVPCCLNGMEASITTTGNGYAPPTTGGVAGTNFGTGGNGGSCSGGSTAGGGAGFYGNGSQCNAGGKALSYVNGGTGGKGYDQYSAPGGFGGGGGVYDSGTGMRGGGGGGYSGGGGGVANNSPTSPSYDGAGGGGGSYSNGANPTASISTNMGSGMVIIEFVCDVFVSASGSNSTAPHICTGGSVTLTNSGNGGYNWSTGETTSSIVVSPTVTTTYTMSATGSGGCTNVAGITVTVSSNPPTLTLTANTASICSGNTVSLVGEGALTYSWSTGATGTASTSTLIDSPSATTNYTLWGTNGCGTSSLTTNVLVSYLPVTASTNTTLVCAASPAILTGGGATTYTWNPGNAVAQTYTATPSASTIYTVTGGVGPCTYTATVAVNTNPLPTMTITASSGTICGGDQLTLNVAGNANSYTWNPGGSNATSITDNPNQSIVYSISGTDSHGCVGNATELVIVKPAPNVSVSVSNSVICAGNSSTLTAHGAATYVWDGGASTGSVNVVTPGSTTTYSVVGTGTGNCSSSVVQIDVTVLSSNIGLISDVPAVCAGSHANLTASGADTYNWSNQATAPSIVVNPTLTTVYTVTGTSTDPNSGLSCDATNSISISVNPNPTITASANPTIICSGNAATLTADGAGATGTYTWAGGAGIVTTVTNAVSPFSDQTYTVTGADANGCKSKGTVLVAVSPCTGIAAIAGSNTSLLVYPNPSNGEFTITSDQDITLQICNELGQHIKTVTIDRSNREIKVNGLANGVYFITGQNGNGSVKQKIMIAK